MKKERRSDLRVSPSTLKTDIRSSLLINKNISIQAEIIDISRSGIRIKLKEPLQNLPASAIKITMYLPDSKTPFSVLCVIKNQHSMTEYGLHYIQDQKIQGSIDDLLFECVRLEKSMFLIKSSCFTSLSQMAKISS
ncbi:MAG: PilZ domain-containing protein [Methylococcales bacterium]|nr:PilZ domain-containing protein [Methylococcales bacterium]